MYRQYHVLGIKNNVLCSPEARIIQFLFPIHDTADTQRHSGNNLYVYYTGLMIFISNINLNISFVFPKVFLDYIG